MSNDKSEQVNKNTSDKSISEASQVKEDLFIEYAEILIDSLSQGEILEEIPLVKTGHSLYRLVNAVRAKRFNKKLNLFIEEMRNKAASSTNIEAFQQRLRDNKEFREQVIDHIIEQLDGFEDEYKAKILARLLIAFSSDKIQWRDFLDLSYSLQRAHIIALGRLRIQDEYTIPVESIEKMRYQGIPIQAKMEDAVLLEACGLAIRPQTPPSETTNILLTRLGIDMLIYGVQPDGPWSKIL